MRSVVTALVFAVLCGMRGFAGDQYLYWMLDNYETDYKFDSARVSVVGDESVLLASYGLDEAYVADNGSASFVEMYTPVLSPYQGSQFGFMLELLIDDSVGYRSDVVNWSEASIVASAFESDSPTSFVMSAIPEPSGGLLMMIGIGVLVLRRRGRIVVSAGRRVVSAAVLLAALSVSAAYDDTMICFSTEGVDRYADGTPVRDGERYALVWSTDGEFEGFKADGTTIDAQDEVLMIAAVAKDGRCPLSAYAMPSTRFKRGGVLALWVLDTRVYASDGTVSFSAADGVARVKAVSAASKVTADIVVKPSVRGDFDSLAAEMSPTEIPRDTPCPVITGMRVDDAANQVYLTVSNTVSYLNYDVFSGPDPKEMSGASARHAVTGGGVITLVVEKKSESGFFAVGRKK